MSYTKYTKHIGFYLSFPISVTVSLFTVSTFIFRMLTPNIPFLLTAIPQHIISPSLELDTQHFLKPSSHFW